MITFEELGRTRTSSAGTSWMPASNSKVDGLSVSPPGTTWAPERAEEALEALAGGDRKDPGPAVLQAGVTFGDLLAHIADVEVGHLADPLEQADGGLGLVGVDVDLESRLVADHQDRVAERLEAGQVLARGKALPGDDEVGAVAKAAVLVVGAAEARASAGARPRATARRRLAGRRRPRP